MRLNCSKVLNIFGKNSLIFKEKCIFVLNLPDLRLKLFLIWGKSEDRVLKKMFLKKKSVLQFRFCLLTFFCKNNENPTEAQMFLAFGKRLGSILVRFLAFISKAKNDLF